MPRGTVYCQSCGYPLKGCSGDDCCDNKDWHIIDLDALRRTTNDGEKLSDDEVRALCLSRYKGYEQPVTSGPIPYATNAEIINAASRSGINRANMMRSILNDWAATQNEK